MANNTNESNNFSDNRNRKQKGSGNMQIKTWFVALAAALVLIGCSNNTEEKYAAYKSPECGECFCKEKNEMVELKPADTIKAAKGLAEVIPWKSLHASMNIQRCESFDKVCEKVVIACDPPKTGS